MGPQEGQYEKRQRRFEGLAASSRTYKPTFLQILQSMESRDSSVGTGTGYGLDDQGSRVRFAAGAGNFSPHHCVQNGSEAHPASYPMGTRDSIPGGKAAGARG
jgi:hypothetical protein